MWMLGKCKKKYTSIPAKFHAAQGTFTKCPKKNAPVSHLVKQEYVMINVLVFWKTKI